MSSNGFATALRLEPARSARLAAAVVIAHGLGAYMALAGPWPPAAGLALALAVAASLVVNVRRYWAAGRLTATVWRPDNSWRVRLGGRWRPARLVAVPYCSPGWVVLCFRVRGAGRRRLVLGRDAVPADAFRRLRGRLRVRAQAG